MILLTINISCILEKKVDTTHHTVMDKFSVSLDRGSGKASQATALQADRIAHSIPLFKTIDTAQWIGLVDRN